MKLKFQVRFWRQVALVRESLSLTLLHDPQLGQYDKAIDYDQQSLAIAREIKDRRTESIALKRLEEAYKAIGQVKP